MPRISNDITNTELAILIVLWDHAGTTVREISELAYPGHGDARHDVTQRILSNLELKGMVHRDRTTRPHRFETMVSRDDLIGIHLEAMASSICGGDLLMIATNLVKAGFDSSDDAEGIIER